MNIVAPGIKSKWDNNNWWQQQLILQYEYGREYEEHKQLERNIGNF